MQDAMRTLIHLAGSHQDASAMIRDMAGYNNVTTVALKDAYNDCADARQEEGRIHRILHLYPLRSLSLQAVRNLGFDVGPDLWESVKSCNPYLHRSVAKKASKSGRQRKIARIKIKSAWYSIAQETSNEKKVYYGTRVAAALAVRRTLGANVTLRTLINSRPRDIIFAGKKTDMCGVCVQLRRLQKSIVTLRSQAKAAKTSSSKKMIRANISEVGQDIRVLMKHKNYVRKIRSIYKKDFGGKPGVLTITMDWCTPVKFTSNEGTSEEFFRPSYAQCMGAHASYTSVGGESCALYIHAYGEVGTYQSKNAQMTCATCFFLVSEAIRLLCPVSPRAVNVWLDTAKHYRNRLLLNELQRSIFDHYTDTKSVKISFHVPQHGKTALDGSFRWAQEWVRRGVDLREILDGCKTQKKALQDAYGSQPTKARYHVCVYPKKVPWGCRAARFFGTARIASVRYRKSGEAAIT